MDVPLHTGASLAPQNAQLARVAVQFEGMFVAQLLRSMRDATQAFAATHSPGAQAGEGLLDHAWRLVADDLASTRAFGIADSLIAQLQIKPPHLVENP